MYAIEFETVVKNGFIQLPAEHTEFALKPVKVVVILDESEKAQKIEQMQALVNESLASQPSTKTMAEIKALAKTKIGILA
ncbi:hypothetical protein [Thiomicrorhabdus aquaedulcis]|uniref:hypothetical protein n=1 Tax=Thiomicrorhabdus aquaedulcis TaxID=2211106 RepID=UPI000FD6FF9D|nr:hypothetical protein [Thiomicrorhabdus aquaedulcis]